MVKIVIQLLKAENCIMIFSVILKFIFSHFSIPIAKFKGTDSCVAQFYQKCIIYPFHLSMKINKPTLIGTPLNYHKIL